MWSFRLVSVLLFAAGMATIEGKPQTNVDDFQYVNDYDYDGEDNEILLEEEEQEIVERIHFVSKGSTHVIDKGTTIRLPCYLDKFPENFVIMWRKVSSSSATGNYLAIGSNVISNDNRFSVEVSHEAPNAGSTLLIRLADDNDAGQYVCQLGSNENREIKHTVQVRDPPTITKTPSNGLKKVEKGADVILSCEGSGNPKPKITWTRVGKKMPDGHASIEADELIFKNVNRRHSGTYVCTANNGYGEEARDRIQLDVDFVPEVSVEKVFIHAVEENEVELVCLVHAHPTATVKWFKNSIELTDEDAKLEKLGHRHVLTIPAVSRQDYGNYTCRARNVVGEASTVLEVSGLADFADFKSIPRGQEPNSFLLEWTSQSQTPITEFELMYREEGSDWKAFTVQAYKESAFSWAGKHSFSGMNVASRYEARVSAHNSEGWSRPSEIFHFATFGAEPRTSEPSSGMNLRISTVTILSSILAFFVASLV